MFTPEERQIFKSLSNTKMFLLGHKEQDGIPELLQQVQDEIDYLLGSN